VWAEEMIPTRKHGIRREVIEDMEERRKWKHQSTDKVRQEYKRLSKKLLQEP